MRPNNICCIGGNLAGGLSSCVIALKCPEVRVTVLDNEKIISEWNSDNPPFNEPDQDQILKKCRNRNLFFSSNYPSCIRDADMIFLPLSIPIKSKSPGKKKVLDFRELEEAVRLIAAHSESDKIVVERSMVSARAAERISSILNSERHPGVRYHVLSNPAFITEGSAVQDLLNPKYVLIGCQKNPNNRAAAQSLCELYEHWVPRKNISILHNWSVEVATLAANAFLAQKMSSLNALATICEETGVDTSVVTTVLNKDSRLQTEHMGPSLGFGALQKDVSSLILMCEMLNLPEVASYWQAVLEMNEHQTNRFVKKVKSILDPIQDEDITVLGFARQKNTSETRNSPAIEVCDMLLQGKWNVKIYDPAVEAKQINKDLGLDLVEEKKKRVQICTDLYLAIIDTSAIIICTDWDEFATLDYSTVVKCMKRPVVIDGHKILNGPALQSFGIEYYTIGSR